MEKRITKAQRFSDIICLLDGETPTYHTTIDEAKAFIEKEIALLNKKNSGDTKKAKELQTLNNALMNDILTHLTALAIDGDTIGVTCSEIQSAIPSLHGYQNQKIARLCRVLADDGLIIGETVKGKKMWRARLEELTQDIEDANNEDIGVEGE